ncbi:MAG: hybrid sensor histidine kinase/response regulator, partial [Bacteroidetes bacterium]
ENQDLEEIGKINKIVLQSSTQTHKLLLNLLEWSKAQTNQIQYKPEKIDIHKIINAQIELFKYQANKKGLQLKDESNHCLVFADMNLLNTVLRNLISNAVKYTKKGEILIKCIRETSNYKISISDTGVGISKENLKKLFDIGENTSTPGTDGERGTGLGLILCKEFVEKNKGEFFVESTVNKGSVFSFSLPLYEDELLN